MVSLGQSNSKEIFTGGGRLYAAGFNSSVFERMCREWTSLSANCSRKCRSSGSVCSALRMWTKPAARSSSPSRRPMLPCTSRKNASGQHCVLTQTTKNLSRFPVDFTGTSGEVFLLFLSGKPMLLCQRSSGIPLRQPPPMRPWTSKLTLTSRNCCLLYYWPNCCHHRQVHARVNLFHN